MIKLNKNLKVGDKINIDLSFESWQVAEAKVDGEYVIEKIEAEDTVTLKRIADGKVLQMPYENACYLTGEQIDNPKEWKVLEGVDYQPSPREMYGYDYISKDEEAFGFWYVGYAINNRETNEYLSAGMIRGEWGYVLPLWKKSRANNSTRYY